MKTQSKIIFTALLFSLLNPVQAKESQEHSQKLKARPCFSSLDTNSDGVINFEEFSAHQLPRGKHETVFANFDSDDNGEISQQEFKDHKPPQRRSRKDSQND